MINILTYILSGAVGFLMIVLGINKKIINKQKTTIDNLNTEVKVRKVNTSIETIADKVKQDIDNKIVESRISVDEIKIPDKPTGSDYNDLIEGF